MYCRNCGKQVSESTQFCVACGVQVYGGDESKQQFDLTEAPMSGALEGNPFDYYLRAWRKYAVFGGRARRREYWYFELFNILAIGILSLIEGMFGLLPESETSILASIYYVASLVPNLAVGFRRMHDTNHSGWWYWLPIINLIFAVTNGQRSRNRFGPDPKSRES